MRIIKLLCFVSALSSFGLHTTLSHAGGSKPPGQGNPGQGEAALDFALNIVIAYAKTDPRYAAILATLGINNAEDLKRFLQGNRDGTNFRNILARLAFLQGKIDPTAQQQLQSLGLSSELDLRKYLGAGDLGIGFDQVLDMALKQALSNSKYSVWLERMGIDSIEDLRLLMQGEGKGGNLLHLVAVVALNYVESNPEYAQYAVYVRMVMAAYGVVPGKDGTGRSNTSDDDIIDLGAVSGMTVGEVKAVQRLR